MLKVVSAAPRKRYPSGFRTLRTLARISFLVSDTEIDEYISNHHNIQGREGWPRAGQVQGLVIHHPTEVVPQIPITALLLKVLEQQGGRKAAVHFQLAVPPRTGSRQDIRGEVSRHDTYLPSR